MRHVSELSDEELKTLIHNHERLGRTDAPKYLEAVEELQRRTIVNLDIDRTTAAILAAARQGRCLSYGDVAAANGHAWSFAMHRLLPKHLDLVMSKAHAQQRPLITSIVVNRENVATGDLNEASLGGFTAGARRLGYSMDDPAEFLDDQQRQTFAYAAANPSS